jgi:hypothetical protein
MHLFGIGESERGSIEDEVRIMSNTLRTLLFVLSLALLAAGVILELADHGKAEVWAAMTGVIGALVGQHITPPT